MIGSVECTAARAVDMVETTTHDAKRRRPNQTGGASMENVFKINGTRKSSSTMTRSLHDPMAVH